MFEEPRLERWVELRLVPTPRDLDDHTGRCVWITFRDTASVEDTTADLKALARYFDSRSPQIESPCEDWHMGSCRVSIEINVLAEIAALLLYRAVYLIKASGLPTRDRQVVLADPDDGARRNCRTTQPNEACDR